jgi:hypothetical protein
VPTLIIIIIIIIVSGHASSVTFIDIRPTDDTVIPTDTLPLITAICSPALMELLSVVLEAAKRQTDEKCHAEETGEPRAAGSGSNMGSNELTHRVSNGVQLNTVKTGK